MPLSLTKPTALLTCSLTELRDVVRAVDTWTETRARQLDQVLCSRVVEALADSSDPEALLALQRAVLTVVPHAAHATLRRLDRDWVARWRAWADLLDARVAQLDARDQDRIHHLKNVPELLGAIRENPGLTQTQLADRMGLSGPNISRLLRILDDHDLIVRRREGTAKRVYPASAAAQATVSSANQTAVLPDDPSLERLLTALQDRGLQRIPMTAPLGDPGRVVA